MRRDALIRYGALLAALLLTSACERSDTPAPTAAAPSATAAPAGPKVYEHEVLSDVYKVEGIYKSMRGPQSTEKVALKPDGPIELLWIIGFEAVMVEPDKKQQLSQEFMCHTNLDIDPIQHGQVFQGNKRISGRLFTLSQGQYRIDMPEGFGLPILSSELMSLNTQVLNLNIKNIEREVQHRIVMRYMRDRELTAPMKALYSAGAYGLKLLSGEDGHYGISSASEGAGKGQGLDPAGMGGTHKGGHGKGHAHHEHAQHQHGGGDHSDGDHSGGDHSGGDDHGPGCLPGENAGFNEFDDGHGRKFTGHWVVKPGREVNHTRVTDIMDLPFDTTLHYVAIHLHPFAESLELRDLTTGKSVYKGYTRQAKAGVGLAHVDFLSSAKGIPLFKDHQYEIISVYNNTSDVEQDSMAVMNLYLLDKEFKKPDLAALNKAAAEARTKPPAAPSTSSSAAPAAPAMMGTGKPSAAPASSAKPSGNKLM